MNLDHLSDSELVQYIIKHDDDLTRVRLAKYMDSFFDRIFNDLKDAGMDTDTWLFENTYGAGEYILHLTDTIDQLAIELHDAREKLADREAMTVSDLIHELNHIARRAEYRADDASRRARDADRKRDKIRNKMKVWRALSTDMSQ